MQNFKKRLLHLNHCRGAGWKTIYNMIKSNPELDFSDLSSLRHALPSLSGSDLNRLFNDLHSAAIEERISRYAEENIHIITYFDYEYPEFLKEIYQAPWVLYGKGKKELLKRSLKLAVVGSRQASEYGRRAIESLFPKLVEHGVLFVSGLAKGIDACVHRTAIKYGGETIGVIAGGFNHLYPKENEDLASYMMEHQLVISEYPPDTKPLKWQFPMRNRIISGLCRGVFVVEAKERSGSLITANFAVNEGREVFALPGNIFSESSRGTNELIRQGAKLVHNYGDILEELFYGTKTVT